MKTIKPTPNTKNARKSVKTAKKRVKRKAVNKDMDALNGYIETYAMDTVRKLKPMFENYHSGTIKREQLELEAHDIMEYILSMFAHRVIDVADSMFSNHTYNAVKELSDLRQYALKRDSSPKQRDAFNKAKSKLIKAKKWNNEA